MILKNNYLYICSNKKVHKIILYINITHMTKKINISLVFGPKRLSHVRHYKFFFIDIFEIYTIF